ncbi:MAG TPA: nitroreductase family protein [Pelolinea sp.]|nr:nitroreductase family protein [Pelolinea sp.]
MNINKIKKIIKSILAIPLIRKTVNWSQLFLYKFLSFSKILAIPYHFLFSRVFDREIFAYTTAVHQYNRNVRQVLSSNVVIRRNIHRLEKGLIMENRRPVFALDYIEETVESYALVLEKSSEIELELGEIHWAHDVLAEYFEVTDATHPLIHKLKERFLALPIPERIDKPGKFRSFESKKRADLKIPSYDEILNLSLKRRSVRWFKDKKVPREDVDKALRAALLAPSACNRQPFNYRIFDDPGLAKEIANIPFGTAGYADNIPTVIVVVGDLSNFFSSRDRHTIYIDASLSVMAFMYALETLGLSSVAINWPDFGLLESKMKKKLNLKAYERPVVMLGVGYAKDEGMIPYSKKKPLELIRSYNDLSNQN